MQWWHKSLDVEKSPTIRGNAARELLAWMSMYHPMRDLGISTDSGLEAERIRTVTSDPFASRSADTGLVIVGMHRNPETL